MPSLRREVRADKGLHRHNNPEGAEGVEVGHGAVVADQAAAEACQGEVVHGAVRGGGGGGTHR